MLGRQLIETARDQVDAWMAHTVATLPLQWRRAASMSNTLVRLTPDEVRALDEQINQLLGPYVMRADPPADAAPVRVLRHFLPEATS